MASDLELVSIGSLGFPLDSDTAYRSGCHQVNNHCWTRLAFTKMGRGEEEALPVYYFLKKKTKELAQSRKFMSLHKGGKRVQDSKRFTMELMRTYKPV